MLAHVWFLSRVRADVYSQGTPLDEAFAAARRVALVRPLIRVYAVVSLEIGLAVEALGSVSSVHRTKATTARIQ